MKLTLFSLKFLFNIIVSKSTEQLYNNEIGEGCKTNTVISVTGLAAYSSTNWLVWYVLRYRQTEIVDVGLSNSEYNITSINLLILNI